MADLSNLARHVNPKFQSILRSLFAISLCSATTHSARVLLSFGNTTRPTKPDVRMMERAIGQDRRSFFVNVWYSVRTHARLTQSLPSKAEPDAPTRGACSRAKQGAMLFTSDPLEVEI